VAESNSVELLMKSVVDQGFCVGCGACAVVQGSGLEIRLDNLGRFQAAFDRTRLGPRAPDKDVSRVCPFSDSSSNEDEIGDAVFGGSQRDPHLGHFISTYAGYVSEGGYRAAGSSGGVGKWLLCELLGLGLADAIIQVYPEEPSENSRQLFSYRVVDNIDDAKFGSKSAYYPVEMSAVLRYVTRNPKKYAIIGVPCFIKALRLLANEIPVFQERISVYIGLFCGHLKTTKYADMLAWQYGVTPGELHSIDFRKMIPGTRANEKGVEVTSRDGVTPIGDVRPVQSLFGANYGYGFLKYSACDYCDDVAGETADVSIGDAWLPEFVSDGRGTNVVVVRSPEIKRVLDSAIESGRLSFRDIDSERVVASQAGGFRHRRDGLAYRLYLARQTGRHVPQKRVKPRAMRLFRKRRRVYELRSLMTEMSHSAFADAVGAGDFTLFERVMKLLIDEYEMTKKSSPSRRYLSQVKCLLLGGKQRSF